MEEGRLYNGLNLLQDERRASQRYMRIIRRSSAARFVQSSPTKRCLTGHRTVRSNLSQQQYQRIPPSDLIIGNITREVMRRHNQCTSPRLRVKSATQCLGLMHRGCRMACTVSLPLRCTIADSVADNRENQDLQNHIKSYPPLSMDR